ncbi:TPA: ABC transporter ATP-binding protein, partial [Streptococcus agalactiae]|nr:ABC transporter ATP-binding protein [Streptococcus agalactiae]
LLQLVLNYQANNQSMLIVIDHLITYYQDIMDHYFWLKKRLTRVDFDYMLNRLNVFELEKKSHNTGDKLLSIKDFQVKLSKNKFISYLDFDLASGERLCLDGPSGVGKSSFFMGLLGLYRTKGKKQFTHRKQIPISFLFQNPLDQFIFSTVYDEIFQVCKDSNKARDILETINLWDKKQFSPFQLSQGQQRRLAIGSILASDSKLLLLDEPTYGQDAYHANMITTLLLSYCHKNHCGVIFTSHDPHLKECFATRFLEVSSCSI